MVCTLTHSCFVELKSASFFFFVLFFSVPFQSSRNYYRLPTSTFSWLKKPNNKVFVVDVPAAGRTTVFIINFLRVSRMLNQCQVPAVSHKQDHVREYEPCATVKMLIWSVATSLMITQFYARFLPHSSSGFEVSRLRVFHSGQWS